MDALIVDEPRFVGLAVKCPGRRLVYRATDLYATMRKDPSIAIAERSICAQADHIVATSQPVAEHLERLSGRRVHVIANGVDYKHFATPAGESPIALPGQRRERAIYVGAFDERFGRQALLMASHALSDKHFLLVGPGGESVAAALRRPNIHALGAQSYELLPRILQQCSVGLLPMSANTANCGRSPMKLYEYAAAGLTVAASDTPELRRRRMPTLCLADDDAHFAQTVSQAFDLSHQSDAIERGRQLAASESWRTKSERLLELALSHPSNSLPA